MAIKNLDELLAQANALMPENSSDEYLAFVEDITDTINANANNEYNKEKYDQLDASWRQRYKERFMSGGSPDDDKDLDDDEPRKLTYENLFKEEK